MSTPRKKPTPKPKAPVRPAADALTVAPPPAPAGPGRFITFEGGEGAGKSTQIALLAEALRAAGLDVVATREPGGSPLAERLRTLILAGKAKNLGPEAEAMFFAAARADHVDHLIRPALDAGKWVLSDRFADSTRVYQGVTGAVPPALIDLLETVALDGLKPDLTLVLDLPVAEGLARAGARRGDAAVDRFEGEDMSVQEARRQGFLTIAEKDPARVAVINAADTPDIVALRVRTVVSERLGVDFGMI